MALTYSRETVIWTYHESKPTVYDPTSQRLSDWDNELRNRYEANLQQAMGESGIPLTRENKSRVLLLAVVSTGDEGSLTQVRRACRYYLHTEGLALG